MFSAFVGVVLAILSPTSVATSEETGKPAADIMFSPSNARTEDGNLIPAEEFFPAKRCAGCHRDTHEAWSESLHRNAGREPFYKDSVDILERTLGSEPTQHCESCHAPVSVFSGALRKGSKKSRAMDDEGVTCSVCHSITEARLDGTGSYTIRRPALLAREDGTPVYGDVSDATIMADIPGHRRAVMSPLLKTPEFCGTCHKSAVTPALNNYKFLRGFSAYDEWQQSAASRETVAPFYKREVRADCRTCHMPRVEAANDAAPQQRQQIHQLLKRYLTGTGTSRRDPNKENAAQSSSEGSASAAPPQAAERLRTEVTALLTSEQRDKLKSEKQRREERAQKNADFHIRKNP